MSAPLSIVWGSPNNSGYGDDNYVSFYSGLNGTCSLIGTVEAADLCNNFGGISNTTDPGYLIAFGVPKAYQSVIFGTTPSAFEFAVTAGVPEASTWAMLLAGFAGLGFLGFGRSRQGITMPA
jgi:hypothetical protein